jgi:hypothetical protein
MSSGRTGRHHRNAAAPVAISLRSIHAFGVTATAKAAYAVTGIFFYSYPLQTLRQFRKY